MLTCCMLALPSPLPEWAYPCPFADVASARLLTHPGPPLTTNPHDPRARTLQAPSGRGPARELPLQEPQTHGRAETTAGDRARANADLAQRRHRALHALAQMQLLGSGGEASGANGGCAIEGGGDTGNASAAETLSDTLSADTPFASPRGSIAHENPAAAPGGAAPAPPEEATPGFTPTDEPPPPRAAPWLTVGPPQVAPGPRHSWLYIPLLRAAAGRLSDAAASAWRELPRFGDRWATLVDCLRNSAPASPHTLARLIRAIAELDAQEAAAGSTAADDAAAASLGSLPEAPLPLSAALLLCAQPDGYIPAASQAALLETYGGIPCAAAAQALAADVKATFHRDDAVPVPACPPRTSDGQEPGPNPRGRGRHRGNGRRGRRRGARLVQGASPPQAASDEALPEVAGGGASSDDAAGTPHTATAPGPIPGAAPHSFTSAQWATLDDIDLAEELRHPVPTIQEVPPFLRGAVRGALVQALRGLQAAQGYDREKQVTRAWALFLLAPRMLLARVPEHGRAGRRVLLDKAQAFQRGEWTTLLRQARDGRRGPQVRGPVDASRRRETACAKVRNGEVSRARHVLTSADLAPGDDTTFTALTDPERRPPRAAPALADRSVGLPTGRAASLDDARCRVGAPRHASGQCPGPQWYAPRAPEGPVARCRGPRPAGVRGHASCQGRDPTGCWDGVSASAPHRTAQAGRRGPRNSHG